MVISNGNALIDNIYKVAILQSCRNPFFVRQLFIHSHFGGMRSWCYFDRHFKPWW